MNSEKRCNYRILLAPQKEEQARGKRPDRKSGYQEIEKR